MYLSFFAILLLSSFAAAAAAAATAASYDLAHLRSEPLSDYVPSVKDLASDLMRSMMPITRNTTTTTTITESKSASNVALQDTLLTGYCKLSIYFDYECKILSLSYVRRLNTCYKTSGSKFFDMFTANATTVTITDYTDSNCTVRGGEVSTGQLTTSCEKRFTYTVGPTTEVPSTVPVFYNK
jgi:hypothetical protein